MEIVEVKGSVELAPLTGLVDGIVDLTATGTTLRENGLEVVEQIAVATARLIANPVAHKLKAVEIDRAGRADPGADVRIVRDVVPQREHGPSGGELFAGRSVHVREMLAGRARSRRSGAAAT